VKLYGFDNGWDWEYEKGIPTFLGENYWEGAGIAEHI
jgi:hypothetical protein